MGSGTWEGVMTGERGGGWDRLVDCSKGREGS